MVTTAYPRLPVNAPSRPQDYIYDSTVDQKFALGTILDLDDGRRFRYAYNGAVILYKALMAQSRAVVAGWQQITQTGKSAAVGDTTYGGLITTAVTANDWDEGWMFVDSGHAASLGDYYKIASHTVHATAPTVTIADPGGIRTAFDATAVITFQPNRWHSVVVAPTTLTGQCVGVPAVDIPINYYGWLQTRGPAALILDTAADVVVGENVGYPATISVAGTCENMSTDNDVIFGVVINDASAAAAACLVDLQIE